MNWRRNTRASRARSARARMLVGPLALGLLVAIAPLPPARAQPAPATAPATAPGISQEASDAVARMGKSVAAAKELVFTARTVRVYLDETGQPLHIFHSMKAVMRRPNRLAVELTGDDGTHYLFYDGKSASVFSPSVNEYASIAVPGDISSALNEVLDKLNMNFPLSDFFADAPDKAFLDGVVGGWQVGTDNVDGVQCRHLFFVKRAGVEVELWVEDNNLALPHRLIVTYRLLAGQPSFVAELTSWDPRVKPSDSDFVFKPPPGARQIEMGRPAAPAIEGRN